MTTYVNYWGPTSLSPSQPSKLLESIRVENWEAQNHTAIIGNRPAGTVYVTVTEVSPSAGPEQEVWAAQGY